MPQQSTLNRVILAFARLEPSGLAPFAPGTFGSLFALVLAPFFFLIQPFWMRLLSLTTLFFVGAWASTIAEKLLQKTDPSEIVIDELVGLWIALLPLSFTIHSFRDLSFYLYLLLAFGFFRFFDILKPFPVSNMEHMFKSGYGIMLDDVVAGLYALLCVTLVRYFFL